jgi:hypothetical protein
MLNIINSATLYCAGFGVLVLLNDFSAMAMVGRRGVSCYIGCQANEGLPI